MADGVQIRIDDFYTAYKHKAVIDPETGKPTGELKLVEVDYVKWHPTGDAQYTGVPQPIHEIDPEGLIAKMKANGRWDEGNEQMGLKIAFMREKWAIIEPAYKAWKEGKELPETGTPLAAWAGVTPEQIKVLQMAGIRSVEDLAHAQDNVMERARLPNKRDLQRGANAFLESKDASAATERQAELERQNDAMKDELAEMKAMIAQMQAEKPKRGRPKKEDAAPAEGEAA